MALIVSQGLRAPPADGKQSISRPTRPRRRPPPEGQIPVTAADTVDALIELLRDDADAKEVRALIKTVSTHDLLTLDDALFRLGQRIANARLGVADEANIRWLTYKAHHR